MLTPPVIPTFRENREHIRYEPRRREMAPRAGDTYFRIA